MKHRRTALAIVALGVVKTSAWQFAPPDMQAEVWNASMALFTAVLLFWLGVIYFSLPVCVAIAFTAGVELQTAACSIAYIAKPWEIRPGEELCSSGMGWPVSLLLGWAAICVVIYLRGDKKT